MYHSKLSKMEGGSSSFVRCSNSSQEIHIILNREESPCSVCKKHLKKSFGAILQDCGHLFCFKCLELTIQNAPLGEIRCPLSLTSQKCPGILYDKEIKQILSNEEYEKLTSRMIKLALGENSNLFYCKSKGCNGVCEINSGSKVFLCQSCEKSNCISCNAIHENIDCQTYQNILKTPGISQDEIKKMVENEGNKTGFNQITRLVNSISKNASQSDNAEVLQTIETLGYFPSTFVFECSICFSDVEEGNGVILECTHMFCKVCIIGIIENADDPTIKCPYTEEKFSCNTILEPRLIREVAPREIYEKLERASIKQAEGAIANTFHCLTPDCSGWCELEFEVYEDAAESPSLFYTCEVCEKKSCLRCKVIHENVTCEDYRNTIVQNQNDLLSKAKLEESIRMRECMYCPSCKSIVTKEYGCDAIQCTLCKTHICWATRGPRWGPKGPGDTSGGCRCRLNGPLCVPNCQNCH